MLMVLLVLPVLIVANVRALGGSTGLVNRTVPWPAFSTLTRGSGLSSSSVSDGYRSGIGFNKPEL